MSVEDAKNLYKQISNHESLQSEFEGLKSGDEAIDKALEVAGRMKMDVSRQDVMDLLEEISEELSEEELENVAGGHLPQTRHINGISVNILEKLAKKDQSRWNP